MSYLFSFSKGTLLITIHLRYSGWLGTVAARYSENGILSEVLPSLQDSQHRLASVAGTRTCHMVQVCAISNLFSSSSLNFISRVLKASSLMGYGGLLKYKLSMLAPLKFTEVPGPCLSWLVDERGRTILHRPGKAALFIFGFNYS